MDYINGKDFFSLKELPNNSELELIATGLAKLNTIEYKPLIDKAFKAFKSCDLSKLKYGFVHGDIIETNVIRDNNGKLYFIDFSVSNYQPRIVDLAITICDLCLDLEDVEMSKTRAKNFINAYEKVSPLSTYEKQCLRKFIVCHQAITILQSMREKKVELNDSEENESFLQKGKQGLRVVLNDNSIKECLC